MSKDTVKVVFIVGWGRSGSTILDSILGELDGFFSGGEIRRIWAHMSKRIGRCSCDRPYEECEIWGAVRADNFGAGARPLDPGQVFRWQHESTRYRNVPRAVRLEPGRSTGLPAVDSYVEAMGDLYRSVAAASESGVVVDSTKHPGNAALLALMEGIDPYYVHLVRDPRAVAFSWQRSKWLPDVEQTGRKMTAVKSAFQWDLFNLEAEMVRRKRGLGRWYLLRYEDFVAHPRDCIAAIAAMVGEGSAKLPFTDEHTVELGVRHMVWGNPTRFQTGTVRLRDDDEWIAGLRTSDRLKTTALTLPLLPRYRYPLRLHHDGTRA